MITLTFPYPLSANRYWMSLADPAAIASLWGAIKAAARGETRVAIALVAEHAGKTPFVRPLVFPSTEAKAYKKLVEKLAREQGITRPLAGPVEVTYELYPQLPQDWAKRAKKDPLWWDLTVRCIDLDNARKVLNDAMKDIVFGDDSMIRKDPGEIMVPDGEARVVVTIKPYVRAHPQAGLFHVEPTYVPESVHVKRVPPLEETPF